MGSRGASSGISNTGYKYGAEYPAIYRIENGRRKYLVSGNIKFVKRGKQQGDKQISGLVETMTKNRVYAIVGSDNKVHTIVYMGDNLKKTKAIDITHAHKKIQPHTHHGELHNEQEKGKIGASRLTSRERAMVDRVEKIWQNWNKTK